MLIDTNIKLQRLHEDASFSLNAGSAGMDLHATKEIVIPARESILVDSGFAMDATEIVPTVLRNVGVDVAIIVMAKSGLSVKAKLEKGAGLIDQNYRKEIKVHLYNQSDVPIIIPKRKKYAQLMFIPCFCPFGKVRIVEELKDTGRGGFGSTGD